MKDTVIADNTHVIVIGNEKGGAGKTTSAMHLIVGLLHLGFKVASIDLDSRQRSLSRYIENRRETIKGKNIDIQLPSHAIVKNSPFNNINDVEADEKSRLLECFRQLSEKNDFLVIDTPGSDSFMSRIAHSYADTVITPINDSFVDLDVLAKINKDTLEIERPGVYSEMIWEQKIRQANRSRGEIDWIVMRNRLSNIDARNKRNMARALRKLSKRIGFRVAAGFGERVIFRELFLHGLTLIDIMDHSTPVSLSLSHIAARQELREFLESLQIPEVTRRLALQETMPVNEKRQNEFDIEENESVTA